MFGMIGADLFTSVMIYLMWVFLLCFSENTEQTLIDRAVVVFRIWYDFMRVVFLVLLHTGACHDINVCVLR